jgi:hypothetical protein
MSNFPSDSIIEVFDPPLRATYEGSLTEHHGPIAIESHTWNSRDGHRYTGRPENGIPADDGPGHRFLLRNMREASLRFA